MNTTPMTAAQAATLAAELHALNFKAMAAEHTPWHFYKGQTGPLLLRADTVDAAEGLAVLVPHAQAISGDTARARMALAWNNPGYAQSLAGWMF